MAVYHFRKTETTPKISYDIICRINNHKSLLGFDLGNWEIKAKTKMYGFGQNLHPWWPSPTENLSNCSEILVLVKAQWHMDAKRNIKLTEGSLMKFGETLEFPQRSALSGWGASGQWFPSVLKFKQGIC